MSDIKVEVLVDNIMLEEHAYKGDIVHISQDMFNAVQRADAANGTKSIRVCDTVVEKVTGVSFIKRLFGNG